MSSVRVGLIGAGLLGLTHSVSLAILRNAGLCDLDLVSLFDTDERAAQSLATNIGFQKTAASADELINDTTIDTVFIASPTGSHKDYVLAAAGAGKNIFCEKPLFVTLDGVISMAEAVQKAGVVGGVGLVLHYSPTYRFIKNKIAQTDTGDPIIVTLRDDQCFPIRGLHHTAWRADPTISGGGALIEHSIHDIDLLTWFLGRPYIRDASLGYLTGRQGIEDYARVSMSYENGMEGSLISIWHDMVTRTSNRRLELIYERLFIATDHDIIGPVEYTEGDNGQVIVDRDRVLSLFLEEMGLVDPFFVTLDYRSFGAYTIQDYCFIKAVQQQKEYTPGFPEAMAAHEVVDEIYKISKRR